MRIGSIGRIGNILGELVALGDLLEMVGSLGRIGGYGTDLSGQIILLTIFPLIYSTLKLKIDETKFNSLIKSCRRLTYNEVLKLIQTNDPCKEPEAIYNSLKLITIISSAKMHYSVNNTTRYSNQNIVINQAHKWQTHLLQYFQNNFRYNSSNFISSL